MMAQSNLTIKENTMILAAFIVAICIQAVLLYCLISNEIWSATEKLKKLIETRITTEYIDSLIKEEIKNGKYTTPK